MKNDTLTQLRELAVKADAAAVVTTPHEPAHRYYLRGPDGTLTPVAATPNPREALASSLQAVVAFAAENPETAEVWYSRYGVAVLTDRATRRDRVALLLALSPQVECLIGLEKSRRALDQKAAVLLLRTTFAKCLAPAGNLLDVLRVVKFAVSQSGEQVVQHGKGSIGRSIQETLTGTGALPEYFSLSVPVFAQAFPAIRSTVELALEPDAATQTFAFIPLPGEIERGIEDGEAVLGAALVQELNDAGAEGVPVFYGRP